LSVDRKAKGNGEALQQSRSRGSSITALVADDDVIQSKILEGLLQSWGYKVSVAQDGETAWSALQQDNPPELLLLDWSMAGVDGPELCRRIRKQHQVYHYILMLTSRERTQDVVTGLEAGADDYLAKPIEAAELGARLRVAERILQLQEKLIRAREGLRFQATHDGLTGLWNRAAVLDLLTQELERAVRLGGSLGVLIIDLNHFKSINDRYGHMFGDAVLEEVAHRIRHVIRSYDVVGRYAGEEFLIVLPGTDRTQTRRSAERIRQVVSIEPVLIGDMEIPVSITIGAATASGGTSSAREVLAMADAALYQAKKAGRNPLLAP
jgi:two-component system, cell cycle response regulator